jgi:indole-3-glycerol phosphate synthase
MKNILDEIISQKKKDLANRKSRFTISHLQAQLAYDVKTLSLKNYLDRKNSTGIIAEIKRKSPSKGWLRPHLSVEQISIEYMQNGATALSILTDKTFFGGSHNDLLTARHFNLCPILMKDFVIDEFQIIEAKAFGADIILLIAAVLSADEITLLSKKSHELGLEVILEVHSIDELKNSPLDNIDHIGVNSRNLKDFSVNTELFFQICDEIPRDKIKIAESGINDSGIILKLRKFGYKGFLIGEHFMKSAVPGEALKALCVL